MLTKIISTCTNCDRRCQDIATWDDKQGVGSIEIQHACPSWDLPNRTVKDITKQEFEAWGRKSPFKFRRCRL